MKRHAFLIVALAVLAAAVGLRIADPGPLASLRRLVFDAYLTVAPRVYDPELPVRIVDIDEASLAKLGQWPWPRTRLADIIDRLAAAGAAAIAIDLIFPEPDRVSPGEILRGLPETPALAAARAELGLLLSNDQRLAVAITAAPVAIGLLAVGEGGATDLEPRAALAFAGDEPHRFVPRFAGVLHSLAPLTAAAKGLGAINWVPDHDQIIRRLPLLIGVGPTTAVTLHASLSIEALRLAQGAGTLVVKSSGASGVSAFGQHTGVVSMKVGAVTLPTDSEGQLVLKLTHTEPRRFVSAHKVLDGSLPADTFQGRIVLIGASAPGLLDLRTTPLDRAVPGVELHAQAIEQMLTGDHLVRPDYATGLELLLLVLAGGLLAWLIQRSGAMRGAVFGGLAVGLAVAASWLAYRYAGLLLDPVYPTLALTALYSAGTLVRFQGTEAERAQIRATFSRYMSPAMVEQLAAHPERVKLGGETREVTLLFSDVRGFTRLSEGMDAQALTRFVNELFTPLSTVILDHRGTIDKYIGDAVMAFWNAPLDDAEHARHAARSALAMLVALDRLNARWEDAAAAAGRPHAPVAIGIGLNTGPCCVGNLGSEQRMDYSVIGDDVNLASRLEGLTKTYGVPIIAGERTAAAAPDLAWLEIDQVTVRGKTQSVRILALLGDEAVAQSARFKRLTERMVGVRAGLAGGQRGDALRRLEACRKLAYPGLDGLLAHYEARIGAKGAAAQPG